MSLMFLTSSGLTSILRNSNSGLLGCESDVSGEREKRVKDCAPVHWLVTHELGLADHRVGRLCGVRLDAQE